MVMSQATSPHAFSVVEVDFANVDATRSKVKADFKAAEGFSLTYLPFIARAIVDGLSEFPHLNASVGDDELIVHDFIDLGIAVDLARRHGAGIELSRLRARGTGLALVIPLERAAQPAVAAQSQ